MSLGGDYREKGARDRTRWEARKLFLDKVAELAPDVKASLFDDILQTYREAYQKTQPPPEQVSPAGPFGEEVVRQHPPEWVSWQWREDHWNGDDSDWPPELSQLRKQVLDWAQRWNLQDPWVLDAVLRTLRVWHKRIDPGTSPESEQPLKFHPPRFIDSLATPPFEFCHQAWRPQWTTWEAFNEQVRSEFERQLTAYRKAREAEVEEQGLERSPKKLKQLEANADQHFDWLVRFQVLKQTQSHIAAQVSRTKRTVQDALRHTAELVGITRRSQL